MVELITASDDDKDTPMLEYVRAERDGRTESAWFHPEHDEPLIGSDLGEEAEDADDWSLRWYCPRCGTTEPPEKELAAAGTTSIHMPCATEEEMKAADVQEERVAVNVQNAQAFDDGAFDGTEGS